MPAIHVLIVDDDRDALTIGTAALKRAGHAVTTVAVGTEACGAAVEHAPDLILLDFRFRETTGDVIASGLHTDPRCSGIPVIIITADIAGLKAKYPPNVRRTLLKPCSPELIRATVEAVYAESTRR